jgi:hypothetical protein
MIIKITLFGLVLLLVVIIVASYYVNQEGFDNLPAPMAPSPVVPAVALAPSVAPSVPSVAPLAPSATSVPSVAPLAPSVAPLAPSATSVPRMSKPLPTDPSPLANLMPHSTTYTPTMPLNNAPQRNDVQPQVALSDTGYDAMSLQQKSSLLKTIQQMVKNEVLANRATQPVHVANDAENNDDSSTSCAQGSEHKRRSNVDMSKYIKKDEIPCAGCTLDY